VIEIRHHTTGAVLHQIPRETLERADLTGMNLCSADLAGLNLQGANLTGSVCRGARWQNACLGGADLRGAYLAQGDFRGCDLSGAILYSVSLDSADLTGANLSGANLTGAYLADAKLTGANLSYTNLQSTYLGGTDLTGAQLAFTLFADCHSLPLATGLAAVQHRGPSTLDLSTLRAAAAALPAAFLSGVGLSEPEIAALRALYKEPAEHGCCFLVADPIDRPFATRLRGDLLAHGISCWPFCGNLGAGYVLQIVFNHAVKRRSALVLVCSESSVRSGLVLEAARNVTGHRPGKDAVRPVLIALDDSLLVAAPPEPDDAGYWWVEWQRHAQTCPVIDFSRGTDAGAYKAQLQALLNAL
jgi:hypothetical protein